MAEIEIEYDVRIEHWDNKKAREALSKAPEGQRKLDPQMVTMFRSRASCRKFTTEARETPSRSATASCVMRSS